MLFLIDFFNKCEIIIEFSIFLTDFFKSILGSDWYFRNFGAIFASYGAKYGKKFPVNMS